MKKLIKTILIIACILGIAAICFFFLGCNGKSKQQQGVVYQPKTKSSTMTAEERQAAIAKQKAAMNGYVDSVTYNNSVKLTILVPKMTEDFPLQAAEALASRMLQITAANGIAGYGGDPSFVLATLITPLQRGVTSGLPSKKYTKYSFNFYVANLITGDVFGSISEEIMGVGDSEDLACLNAIQSLENDDQMKSLLKESSKKIINWFENNRATFISKANQYMQLGEYDKAYALFMSVPEAATSCFDIAQDHVNEAYAKYQEQQSESYYHAMLDAMASDEHYNPTAGAYMRSISINSPIYEKASVAYHNYVSRCKDVEDAERAHEMYKEQESLAIERINVEANLKANEALLVQSQTAPQNQYEGGQSPGGGFKEIVTDIITDKAVSLVSFGVDRLLGCLGLII